LSKLLSGSGGEAFVPMTGAFTEILQFSAAPKNWCCQSGKPAPGNHESMSRRGLLGAALPAVLGLGPRFRPHQNWSSEMELVEEYFWNRRLVFGIKLIVINL